MINKGRTNACPMEILSRYLECSKTKAGSDHFLFKPAYCANGKRALLHTNKSLSYTRTRETVVARLKEVCGDINIGLHSLRAGGTTAAARGAVNDRLWKRHGRWRSETAKYGYV